MRRGRYSARPEKRPDEAGKKRRKGRRKSGIAMLEVLVVLMVFQVISVLFLGSAAMLMRQAVRQKERLEANYAAAAAARMLEGEITAGAGPQEILAALAQDGEAEGSLSARASGHLVQIPIKISAGQEENGQLVLNVEAAVGGQKGSVPVMLGFLGQDGNEP